MAILKPGREDRLIGAWNTDPSTATDARSRAAARTLAREALAAQAVAEMPDDQFRSDEEKTAAAAKIVELMTGEKDFDGRLWNGGNGFKTGAEYLRSVKETLSRGMGAAADPELQAWMRMTDAEKDAKVEEERGILSHVGEAAGDIASAAGELVRGVLPHDGVLADDYKFIFGDKPLRVPRLSADEYASAPKDVREASDWMGSVMWDDIPEKERGEYEAKVRDWRGGEWQRLKRRGEYEAKLRRRNALLYLPDMIKSLKSDEAKGLAGELAQNPSEMPRDWTARLKKLPTRDIETLAQIRGMTREHVEGGFFNWIGDMGIGVYNGAHGILSGMGAQEAKIAAMAMGWDGERVNEMINRKHALWSAYAGWSSPVAQLSDDHGAVANFTIGLASAVPFIASMHLKGLGYAACATEMMSEADAQAAAAGIDTTNPVYVARTALMGGLYAYMLKAVSPKFLGASKTGATEEMTLRTAYLKGVMSGLANLDTWKVMSQRTASGALMMAMQQGIAAVNEDLNLGGDAWRDAAQRFTETFVSSIPDMLAFSAHGALEGHARASGGWRKMFTEEGRANRSQNLREAVENAFAVRTAVDGNERIDALRTNTTLAQIAAMRRAWTEGGEKGLARLGFKPEEIAEAKDFFEAERKALGAAEKLSELDARLDEGMATEEFDPYVFAERNDAARRFDEVNGEYTRAVERLAETLRGRMRDEKGAVRDLASVRNVWAQGNAVGAGEAKKDGTPEDTDAGAAALVKAGFAPEDAAALSKAFGAERRGMYSPAATEALREMYTRSTRGRVEATAALAGAFGGRVRTVEGRTYIDLPMPDGGTGTFAVETEDLSQKFYGEAWKDPELARQVERAVAEKGGKVKADDWIKMTDAERRRIVNQYKLFKEGAFVVTDPADPSLHVSSGDAEAVFGTIHIDPRADPGAGFHEAMHGFLRFCQETGFFDEADLKWLTEKYGAGTSKNSVRVKGEDGSVHLETRTEQLDEESAADGFRQYLARRMAGAITEEPAPFRKLFGLISRIRHLRESRAATERLATNAEEALYDAFLAGKYQHVRDLKFAEPAAPKAEAGGETSAPQTGAKPPSADATAARPSVAVPSREQVLARDKANGTEVAEIGNLVEELAKTGKPTQGGQRHYRLAKTSDALKGAGLTGDYFTIKSGVIFKHYGKDADHVLTPEDWASISASLADPLVVSKYSRKGKDGKIHYPENSYRVWTEAVINGKYAMVGVEVKSPGKEITVNAVTTVYGDEHVSLRESDVVYSRGNGEGIRTLLNGPNSRQYPGSPSTPQIIPQSGGENKGGNSPRVVSFEALTPTGGKKVKGHYEIVPLASLLHSNKPGYPMELQQRDRKGNKGEEQTRKEHIANFEAGYLLADPKTDSGAMVVARRPGPDGKPQLVVVSGNGRTMVLEEMAKRNLYDRYRNRMKEWAKENGVENAVADADNPVLVRVVDELGGATLKELADLSNTNAIQQMNEEETARADADLVRSLDLAKLYKPNMDGSANMAAGASDEFFREFVRATGDTSLLNSDGTFTEALRMRARRALLAIACGQGARGRDVVKKLVEDTDALGIDRQKDAAAAIAPHVAAAESRPEYAIGPDVSRAFADYIEFRENRDTGKKWGTLEEYLKQGDMLDPRSEIAEAVMRLLDDPKGAPVLAETVRLYAEAAKGETDGLFGAARSRAEIWRDAEKAVDENAAQERARSEGAFKPETRFSIRSEAEKKDEEKKETTAQGPLSKSDQTPPVQFSGGATSIPLTPESADPVKKFGDSISQDGVKSPAEFLTGLVHALGSTETNPDKTQYFDITHEDGRTMSLRVANHRATAGQYREHGNTAEVKTSIVVKMSDKPFKADADVELTEHVYFSDKLTAEREAAIASGVAEWIRTGEWHGPAADQVNMSPHRRFSIAGRKGAENMGIKGAAEAEAMEKAGADREEIWRTTGWWRGKDGKWRFELPSTKMKDARALYAALIEGHNETTLGKILDAPELFEAYPQLKDTKIILSPEPNDEAGGWYDRIKNEIVLFDAGLVSLKDMPSHERDLRDTYQRVLDSDEFVRRRFADMDAFGIEHGTVEEEREYARWWIERQDKGIARTNETKIRDLANDRGMWSTFGKIIHEVQHTVQRIEGFATGANGNEDGYSRFAGEVEARNASRREAMTPEERAATPPWATEDVPADRQIVRYSVTAQTETPQFKNFFGDWEKDPENASKVVDKDGRPLVVYRRDNKAFTVFDSTKTQQNDAGWLGKGFYFYGDKGEAERETGYGKNLRAFYLNIRNPYYITSEEYNKLVEADDPKVSREFTESLKAEGYDGVYWNGDLRQEWAAFEPTQIKSATDNTGAFDPRNPDVRYSLKAGTASDYSWATLTAKPDMPLAQIEPEKFKNYTKDSERIADARRSIVEAGGRIVGNEAVIEIEGSDVIVGADGIKHRGRKRNNENDMLFPVLGEVMKNAVRVNELEPRADQKGKKENGKSKKDDKVTDVFVYLGAFAYGNEVCPVRIQISQLEGVKKLDRIDVLKSLNTKIGRFASPANTDFGLVGHVGSGPVAHLPDISIANLVRIAQPLHPEIFSRDVAAALGVPYEGGTINARYSISGIYTGTAADYANRSRQGGVDDGPSLKKIGTGEGSQVYGWGLYGSAVRGVAEGYAKDAREYNAEKNGQRIDLIFPTNMLEAETAKRLMENDGDVRKTIEKLKRKGIGSAIIKELEEHGSEYSVGAKHEQLYEQTFFTNRAPGDESHLLKWYEPVSEEQFEVLRKAGLNVEEKSRTVDGETIRRMQIRKDGELLLQVKDTSEITGEDLYRLVAKSLGSPQAASEFLYRAGIDGIKYPVDSYGGKGVKDGDKAGWNYVAFSDEHIRVDHKWTDGQMRYSIRSFSDGTPFVEVDNVPPEIASEGDLDRKRMLVEKMLKNRWMGKILDPTGVRAFFNGHSAHEYTNPPNAPDNATMAAKMDAASELEDIVGTSTKPRAVPDGQSGHVHENVKEWEHRDTVFRVDGRFYSGRVNIAILDEVGGKKGNFRKFHDITAIKDITDEVRYLHGEIQSDPSTSVTPDSVPKPSDEIKADPEAFARRSVVSRVIDGDAEERESALVAFVAERALRHGPKPKLGATIGRLGLEMGLKTVEASRIVQKGEALADRVRGTIIEKAIRKGDVATATALLAREADIDRLVAGAAGQGGQLVRYGEQKIKSILEREIEKTVRSFNAASLADVERDTGIDIADEILHNSPEKFDPKGSARSAERRGETETGGEEGSASGDSSPEEGSLADWEVARRERVRKEAEERVARMIATAKERVEAAKKEREEREARREERRRKAEEAAAAAGEGAVSGDGSGDEGSAPGDASPGPSESPRLSTWADFKTPEEFAAFFRVWAEERYKKEHGASTLGKHEEKRLFPEFYRKAVVRELQDLADKLLPPKGARATVNRWLGEIQPGVKPDTLERISADIFKFINRNAIRESRTATIQKFRNGLQEFIKGPQFDDLKLDSDRKVTGWVEEAARYIRRVCNLSIQSINGEPSQLEKERAELQAILDRREKVYDDEGKNSADAPLFDMETRRALAKLQLLEKYGAMKRYMPGEIADLADEAMTWLRDEAGKLEANWESSRETEESIRAALTGGIVGPSGQKYKRADGVKGWAERLFDSMNGMIRLRLQHLVRFADAKSQQKARDAINRVVVMLGDGEVAFARHLQDDRAAFHQALAQIFQRSGGKGVDRRALADWLNRMTEAIPADLSRRLSKQGYGDSMTYGQMLQLLVSLEQKSYAEAIKANGRDGQADLIRTFETVGPDGRRERVLTDKDILFIDWLRSFYEAKRGMLSEVTKRMTGLPVDSPDPLYCPVKMYMGDRARGMHADSSRAWDPIGAVFSRRVETLRDFDESASILGQFFDRSAASANLVAWGERGSIIRGVFTNASVQESIRRAFGGGELTKILKQLEETFNGGENIKKSPGEIAAADKAMNWMTYLSLGYNPLSAAKQTTSFTVWANALPGGFKDLWRYMTDVDMATIKHIKESEEYKVRYGNEVGSGHDVASKGLFENPSENPVAAFFRKTSMGLLRKGDFLPGGWIAQGVFRDLYNRHLKEGMDPQAADRLAMTETFNMLEETQQSGRTYNTAELAREHGRLGRLLVQFATSPLQQLQYETQAWREVQDLRRYRPAVPDADFEKRYSEAKGRLVRAAVINHVLLPAALHAVTSLYRLAMGYDPEWEQEGWHWTLLRDITLGQFSRVFFIGAISSVTTDVLITGKPVRDVPALIPAEGVVKLFGNVAVTARDVATLNYERVQKDFDRLLKSTSITRTPYDVWRLVTGKAYAEREERREKRRAKEAREK